MATVWELTRGLMAVAFCYMLGSASALAEGTTNPNIQISLPMPNDILALIVSEGDVGPNADFETMLDRGVIQKWTTPIAMFFATENATAALNLNRIIHEQFRPFLESVARVTGLRLERKNDLSQANFIFILAEDSRRAADFVNLVALRAWFGAEDDQFDRIESTFLDGRSRCFRFMNAPNDRISRAIGFVSTSLSEPDQQKCLARGTLFALGLRGSTNSALSAKSLGTPVSAIGLLDELALGAVYRQDVQPGTSLREALKSPEAAQ